MNLRQALIEQGPSLALQREAQAEIARLDYKLSHLFTEDDLADACFALGISDSMLQSLCIELAARRKRSRPTT